MRETPLAPLFQSGVFASPSLWDGDPLKIIRRRLNGAVLFLVILLHGHLNGHRVFAADPMPLSLDGAIDLALRNNLDAAIRAEETRGGEWDIRAEVAVFDPSFQAEATLKRSEDRLFTVEGSGDGVDFNRQTDQNLRADLSQRLPAGGRYSIGLERTHFGPRFGSGGIFRADLVFRLTQPLLRGFGREIVALPQVAARTGHAMLEAEARIDQARIVVAVTEAYWESVFAREHLAIQRQKRQATEALLAQNRVKVDLGLSAAIEVLVAEAAVASREETVVVAEAAIADAEDRIRSLLNLPQTDIVAVDRLPDILDDLVLEAGDADRIASALTRRPEIARQRLDLHRRSLVSQQAHHDRQSALDFTTALAAGGAGRGDGDALDRLGSADTTRWEAGVIWTYPIGHRAADARAQKADSELKVAHLVRRTLERQVSDEVRQAARRVRTDRKRVETTRRARALAEQKRAAGEERFRLGLIDSRVLLEIQDETAEAADGALRAITDAQVSRVRLKHAEGTLFP